MSVELDKTIKGVRKLLLERRLRLASAESCTGGWIAQQATRFPGSSDWFECGFVTYSNEAKQLMLGVKSATLDAYGAVSEAVVGEMALGAMQRSAARVAVAVSGVAGPGGGTRDKPVGLVWLAWSFQPEVSEEPRVQTKSFRFEGSRHAIRRQSVEVAYQGLLHLLKNS